MRLPPLNSLRAFEAAARHLSLKDAAAELCVTPGAVSQAIKTLERHLGTALFLRANRAIYLTSAGQHYLPPVRNALRQIANATDRVTRAPDTGVLTISTTGHFASAWLVPRLADFRAACPDIDLQIRTGRELADFDRDGIDVAIRHGLGRYPGLASERLFAIEMVAVAAPALTRRFPPPAHPRDLVDWPHLHDGARKDWSLWFQAHDIETFAAPRGPAFDDAALLLQAVLAGQGAGLVPVAMAQREIDSGRLIRLAGTPWPAAFAYYLVHPDAHARRPTVRAFRDWAIAAAGNPGPGG